MKKLILFIMMLLIGTVAAQESCDATMQAYFGPHCLNPYTQNMAGFYPIGSYVEFYRPNLTTDIGRVMGYSWQYGSQAYAYYLAVGPFYRIVPNGISGVNEVVYPEFIFAASAAVVGG